MSPRSGRARAEAIYTIIHACCVDALVALALLLLVVLAPQAIMHAGCVDARAALAALALLLLVVLALLLLSLLLLSLLLRRLQCSTLQSHTAERQSELDGGEARPSGCGQGDCGGLRA